MVQTSHRELTIATTKSLVRVLSLLQSKRPLYYLQVEQDASIYTTGTSNVSQMQVHMQDQALTTTFKLKSMQQRE